MSNECEKQGTLEKPRMTNWENLKRGGSSREARGAPKRLPD